MLSGWDLATLLRIAVGPGLWIPDAPSRPVPSTVAPHRVAITCEDIGRITPDAAALAETLSRLSRGGAMECVSRLSITVANLDQPNDQAQQLELARMFFSVEVAERFQRIISGDPSRVIFHRLQLLTLMRFLLNLPTERPGSDFTDDDARVMGLAALAVNGHLEKDIVERLGAVTGADERVLCEAVFGIRNMLFNQGGSLLAQLVGRSVLLWQVLPSDDGFHPTERMFPAAIFEQTTGISFDDYLLWVFLYSLFYQGYSLLPMEGKSPDFFFLHDDKPPIRCPGELVPSHKCSVGLLTAHVDTEEPKRVLRNLYDLRALRRGPLAPTPRGPRVAVDLTFLKEAAPVLTFWIINDYLRDQGGDRASQRWRDFFGQLLEYYVQRLTSSVIDGGASAVRRVLFQADWQIALLPRGRHPHLPDIAILYPGKLALVEVIATRFHFLETAIAANPDRLRTDLDQMVYQPVAQLHGVVEDIRAGIIRMRDLDLTTMSLYPIIVVGDAFAQFPRVWDLIMGELERRGLLGAEERARLQVWDLDEFESLLATIESGTGELRDLAGFLETKISDPRTRFMPLQNYLAVQKVPWEIPTVIRRAFESVWQRAEPILSEALAAERRAEGQSGTL